jgi:hypothetical protein
MKERFNSRKPKRERQRLRLALAKGHIDRSNLMDRFKDETQSRRARRSLAIVLNLFIPQVADVPAPGYEWKYRKKVSGYRVKPIKKPKQFMQEAPVDSPVN